MHIIRFKSLKTLSWFDVSVSSTFFDLLTGYYESVDLIYCICACLIKFQDKTSDIKRLADHRCSSSFLVVNDHFVWTRLVVVSFTKVE